MKSPQRGEVWLGDLGMAAKVRPALVISVPADDVDRALATLVLHMLRFLMTYLLVCGAV